MNESVSAAEANRTFSALLRGVREGRSYVVTSHGRPIARLLPVGEGEEHSREVAREALFARLERQPACDIGRWSRDELYEDDK